MDTTALVKFKEATTKLGTIDIPSKETAMALAQSALQMVLLDLEANNIRGAIETAQNYDVWERYVKNRINGDKKYTLTQNIVVAGRLDIAYETGRWIEKHMVPKGTNRTINHMVDGRPMIWAQDLKDWGMKLTDWNRWVWISRLGKDQLEEFKKPYLQPANGTVDELYFYYGYRFANPPKPKESPKEPLIPMDLELSNAGMKLYKALLEVRTALMEYFKLVKADGITLREAIFMAGAIKDQRKGMTAAEIELYKLNKAVNRVEDGTAKG